MDVYDGEFQLSCRRIHNKWPPHFGIAYFFTQRKFQGLNHFKLCTHTLRFSCLSFQNKKWIFCQSLIKPLGWCAKGKITNISISVYRNNNNFIVIIWTGTALRMFLSRSSSTVELWEIVVTNVTISNYTSTSQQQILIWDVIMIPKQIFDADSKNAFTFFEHIRLLGGGGGCLFVFKFDL